MSSWHCLRQQMDNAPNSFTLTMNERILIYERIIRLSEGLTDSYFILWAKFCSEKKKVSSGGSITQSKVGMKLKSAALNCLTETTVNLSKNKTIKIVNGCRWTRVAVGRDRPRGFGLQKICIKFLLCTLSEVSKLNCFALFFLLYHSAQESRMKGSR